MEISEIEQLLDIVREARVSELTVSVGDPATTVKIRKPMSGASVPCSGGSISFRGDVKPDTAAAHPLPPVSSEMRGRASEICITAHTVGIFHDLGNVISAGDGVKAGQVIGAIESMKLMNEIVSEHDGVISEALIEDGMPVEYGQHLFSFNLDNT